MKAEDIYSRAILILDDFLIQSEGLKPIMNPSSNWKSQQIYKLFLQAKNIVFVILSNTESSKHVKNEIATEPVVFGALGRLLRDIYVNIIYLRTDHFNEEEMKICWEHQIVFQQLKLTQHDRPSDLTDRVRKLEDQQSMLLEKLIELNPKTINKIKGGKEEKLLSLKELSEIKAFDSKKFQLEFDFFSQFTHSTAFGNSFVEENKTVPLWILAVTYDRMVPYFVGIVIECLELFLPEHEDLKELKKVYQRIIETNWN